MRAWRDLGLVVLCWTLVSASTGAQTSTTASRAAALVGLARTARDQGHRESAAIYFRDADWLAPFTGPLLVEYFWAAHAARMPEATSVGERVLAANPREARVRDGLIGLAVAAGNEDQAARLAGQGHVLDSTEALWPRRLGESHLRMGQYLPRSRAVPRGLHGIGCRGRRSRPDGVLPRAGRRQGRRRPCLARCTRSALVQPNGLDREPCPRRRSRTCSPGAARGGAGAHRGPDRGGATASPLDSAVRDRAAGDSRTAGQR